MNQEDIHRFRLDDFDQTPRVTEWEELPRVATHVRWLKQRNFRLLPRRFTPIDFQRYQEIWDALVDNEAEAWREGFSAHGWFARPPENECFEVRPRPCAGGAKKAKKRRQLLTQPYEFGEAIGIPTLTGTEVMTVGPLLDDIERSLMSDDAERAANQELIADKDLGYRITFQEVPVLVAAVAYLRVEDAVLSLIRGEEEGVAWHLLLEATDLVNRGERLNRLTETPSEHDAVTDTRRGVFHISDMGVVFIVLDGEQCRFSPRKGGDGGFRCIQAILKEPLKCIRSEMLAIDILGDGLTDTIREERLPMISKEELQRLKEEVQSLKKEEVELGKDPDKNKERLSKIKEEYDYIIKDVRSRTYMGIPKLEPGPEQKRNRRVGAVLNRAVKAISKHSPMIAEHFDESLKKRNGERPSYEPAEDVDWTFLLPKKSEPAT